MRRYLSRVDLSPTRGARPQAREGCCARYSALNCRHPSRCILGQALQAFKLHVASVQLPLLVCSSSIAPTSRVMAASFGKMSTTLVHRLISVFNRPDGLVLWICNEPSSIYVSVGLAAASDPLGWGNTIRILQGGVRNRVRGLLAFVVAVAGSMLARPAFRDVEP